MRNEAEARNIWGRAQKQRGSLVVIGSSGDRVQRRDPVLRVLLDAGRAAGEQWLYCIYCERFFQAKHLVIDILGHRQGCPFCRAGGFEVAIHCWDTWKQDDPRWPSKTEELHHGRAYPEPKRRVGHDAADVANHCSDRIDATRESRATWPRGRAA